MEGHLSMSIQKAKEIAQAQMSNIDTKALKKKSAKVQKTAHKAAKNAAQKALKKVPKDKKQHFLDHPYLYLVTFSAVTSAIAVLSVIKANDAKKVLRAKQDVFNISVTATGNTPEAAAETMSSFLAQGKEEDDIATMTSVS
jgi:hypothetical protein